MNMRSKFKAKEEGFLRESVRSLLISLLLSHCSYVKNTKYQRKNEKRKKREERKEAESEKLEELNNFLLESFWTRNLWKDLS